MQTPNIAIDYRTRGHSLNLVKTVPEVLKELKRHCTANKLTPVRMVQATYCFTDTKETFHTVVIELAKGFKKDFPYAKWATENKLVKNHAGAWSFVNATEEAREAEG